MATKEKPLNNLTAQTINEQLQKPWDPPKPSIQPAILTKEKTPVELEEENKRQALVDKNSVKL